MSVGIAPTRAKMTNDRTWHSLKSRYREKVIEQIFVGELLRHLWASGFGWGRRSTTGQMRTFLVYWFEPWLAPRSGRKRELSWLLMVPLG
jgi:hypothetical protein